MRDGNFQFKGLNVYYREAGTGTPVILLHCAGGTCGQWRKLIDAMSDRYRLFAFDQFGHGKSDPAPDEITDIFNLEVELLGALAAMVGGPAHFVGHSTGGSAAARYTVRHPQAVRSLTLYEPVLFSLLANGGDDEGWADYLRLVNGMRDRLAAGDREGAAEVMVDYWTAPGSWQRMPEDRKASTIAGLDFAQAKVAQYVANPAAGIIDPSDIGVSTLLLSGTNSPRSARGVVDILANGIPDAELHRIDGGGHMAPLTHAAIVNEFIQQHIERNEK